MARWLREQRYSFRTGTMPREFEAELDARMPRGLEWRLNQQDRAFMAMAERLRAALEAGRGHIADPELRREMQRNWTSARYAEWAEPWRARVVERLQKLQVGLRMAALGVRRG